MASTVAAGNITLAFGAWDRVVIKDVKGVRIVRTSEAANTAEVDAVLVGAMLRSDCALADAGTHPVVYLQQHS
jgi:hypothetical protein